MATSISPSKKSNIITYRNSINNGDSDRNNGSDSGSDNDGINEGYNAKMTYTQDEPGKLVNDKIKLILTSLYVKTLIPGLRLGAAIYFEFI